MTVDRMKWTQLSVDIGSMIYIFYSRIMDASCESIVLAIA